jgi:hypothetical protein
MDDLPAHHTVSTPVPGTARATVRNGHNLKMANRVRVAVRLRPLNDREVNKGACECIEVEGDRYVALPRGHLFGVRLPSLRQ